MNDETKRNRFPRSILIFFAVIFVVNIAYIYISKKTWRGTVTEDSYQKGLHYNETLKEAEKQKELKWKMEVNFSGRGEQKGVIVIDLWDKDSHRIKDATITLNFKRPTQAGLDFVQTVTATDGIYIANVTFPLKGQWEVEVTARNDEDALQQVKRYVIK